MKISHFFCVVTGALFGASIGHILDVNYRTVAPEIIGLIETDRPVRIERWYGEKHLDSVIPDREGRFYFRPAEQRIRFWKTVEESQLFIQLDHGPAARLHIDCSRGRQRDLLVLFAAIRAEESKAAVKRHSFHRSFYAGMSLRELQDFADFYFNFARYGNWVASFV